jgi:hypothetical protein
MCVTNQGFGCVTAETGESKFEFDGVLGMAYPSGSIDKLATPFQTLMLNKTLCPQGVFAFWLSRCVHALYAVNHIQHRHFV